MRRSALVARRPVLCWEYPISRARAHTARSEGSIGGSPLERMLRRATGRRRATRWTSSAIARAAAMRRVESRRKRGEDQNPGRGHVPVDVLVRTSRQTSRSWARRSRCGVLRLRR